MSRSKWKGPFVVRDKNPRKIINRNIEIAPKHVNENFEVQSGNKIVDIETTEDMLGFKFGEFVPTRSRYVFKKKKK